MFTGKLKHVYVVILHKDDETKFWVEVFSTTKLMHKLEIAEIVVILFVNLP